MKILILLIILLIICISTKAQFPKHTAIEVYERYQDSMYKYENLEVNNYLLDNKVFDKYYKSYLQFYDSVYKYYRKIEGIDQTIKRKTILLKQEDSPYKSL
jgi:hypothetical protein